MEPIIVSFFFFFAVIVLWGGYLLSRHRERMSMIEKGIHPADPTLFATPQKFTHRPLTSLKWGIVITLLGIGLLVGVWLDSRFYLGNGVIPGLMALLGGLGLVIFYAIAARLEKKDQSTPQP